MAAGVWRFAGVCKGVMEMPGFMYVGVSAAEQRTSAKNMTKNETKKETTSKAGVSVGSVFARRRAGEGKEGSWKSLETVPAA